MKPGCVSGPHLAGGPRVWAGCSGSEGVLVKRGDHLDRVGEAMRERMLLLLNASCRNLQES